MLMAGLVLGRIDSLKPPETRSVSSDPWLENEEEGIRGPVTVCHIIFGGGCARVRKKKRPVGRRGRAGSETNGVERRSGPRETLADPVPCRDFSAVQRRQPTDGGPPDSDIGRQSTTRFRAANGAWPGPLLVSRWPACELNQPEDTPMKTLMSITGQTAAGSTHLDVPIGWGSPAANRPIDTTKNDKTQNRLHGRHIWSESSRLLMGSRRRRDWGVMRMLLRRTLGASHDHPSITRPRPFECGSGLLLESVQCCTLSEMRS